MGVKRLTSRFLRVSATLTVVLACCVTRPCRADSQVTAGPARFTVITPNLIRIQYSSGGAFTEEPTLFASNRSARFDEAKIVRDGTLITIQTKVFKLVYQADGRPLGLGFLEVDFHGGMWDPRENDSRNLGGTLRTLDGCTGPRELGDGLISRSGWSLVDDSGTPVLADGWVKSRANKLEMDWYLFVYRHDYKAALKSLAAISGGVSLPRKNQLGIWYSRYWPYTSNEFREIVKEYSDHGFPLDNIVMDMDWHITQVPSAKRGYAGQVWTGYTWDRTLLPDAEALLKWFHQQGLHVTLNDHPADGVQPHEQMYADFMRAMGADPMSGKTLEFDAGNKKYLDTFYEYTHKPREKEGVDFWWLDWQQFPFTRSVAELSNLAWLNRYYFLQSEDGGKRGASFSRWGGWGDQKYPIHFSGDANTGWDMLAFEVPFTSTAGNVGCFFWTHDIGGHMGGRNEESYTRWCQFGAMSAALRSHSTRDATMDRRPWKYPEWAENSMRVSFQLRARMMPYIYTSAAESCREMVPLLRPMYLEHPDVEAAYHQSQQYYLGDNLLVAPIASPGVGPSRVAWQTVWFPPGSGNWYDYFTGEKYSADSGVVVAADINQFPLFVRGGVPIPMQPYTPRPTSAVLDHLILRCYPGEIGGTNSSVLYEDDGQTREYADGKFGKTQLTYGRDGEATTVEISPVEGRFEGQALLRSYTIELGCVQKPLSAQVDGIDASFTYDAEKSMAKVEIPPRSIDKSVKVVVRCEIADANTIHREAVARRLSGIIGKTIEPGAIGPMVAQAMDAVHDPAIRTAVLASAGVAIVRTNDAPYLFGGRETFRVFAEPGILDLASATAFLVSGSAQKPGKSESVELVNGSALDLMSLSRGLPDDEAVVVPGRFPTLHVVARIAQKDIEFELPAAGLAPAEADLARKAKATATSSEGGYDPSGAIDGYADGYPGDKRHEWSSDHEKVGAAITLTWETDQSVSRVLLFDRPNLDDQILAGRLVFSDGSVVPFGELANDGKTPASLTFAARSIRWLRMEVTKVSPTTQNAGIAEIAVFH